MRVYLLISGDTYYPAGTQDFMGVYPSVDAAIEADGGSKREWADVVEISEGSWQEMATRRSDGPWMRYDS